MPRNGSGTYSLPESPFIDGTTISAAPVNNDFSDIATALTGSVAADGQTPMTGKLVGTTAAFSSTVTAADGVVGDQVVNNSQFERVKPTVTGGSLAQVFPDGNMIQTGSVSPLTGSDAVVFPFEFAILTSINITFGWSGGPGASVSYSSETTKGFTLKSNTSGTSTGASWMASGTRF